MTIHKILWLFRQYAHHLASVRKPGFALFDDQGQRIGHVDALIWRQDQIAVSGWVMADRVVLVNGTRRTPARSGIERSDVAAALPDLTDARVGFEVRAPHIPAPALLCIERPEGRYLHPLPGIAAGEVRRARRAQAGPFLGRLLSLVPAGVRWKLGGDETARDEVLRGLGLLEDRARPLVLESRLFTPAETPEPLPEAAAITIVMPVYNAFGVLQEALGRVTAHTDLPWHLIAVEDCSTDPAVRPWLRDWAARQNATRAGSVTLLENPQNLGFIRSVNRAFALAVARGDHVVLLNSDALVPPGWASRLIAPLVALPDVASVTPMSNDAEIVNVPVTCRPLALAEGEAEAIDDLARQFHPQTARAEAPTGVGFCMAMSIAHLKRQPELDTAFGRGYGEEVDWCQRARKTGGRHIAAGNLFVEHRGGSSFGPEKMALIRANNAIVADRYPAYDRRVQDFIRDDPLITPRLALALALTGRRAGSHPVTLFVAHSLGGGAELYLGQQIAERLIHDPAGAVIVLRAGGESRWQLELRLPHGVTSGATDDFDLILKMLRPVAALRVVYSNIVGDPDPISVPDLLLALRRGAADRIEVLFHDYLPISPSYTLLDHTGHYRGVPETGDPSPAHRTRQADGSEARLEDWRAAWGRLLAAADHATVFSEDSAGIVRQAYPRIAGRLHIRPHRLFTTPGRARQPAPDARPVIGVPGNIGHQKGIEVLSRLSHLLEDQGIGLVVIGNVDPAWPLAATVTVHGSYDAADLGGLAERYGLCGWFIPSIWPETFSYTTHEALATGLPVIAFDLGAQAEAIRRAIASGARGGVIPLGLADNAPGLLAALLELIRTPPTELAKGAATNQRSAIG